MSWTKEIHLSYEPYLQSDLNAFREKVAKHVNITKRAYFSSQSMNLHSLCQNDQNELHAVLFSQ